MKIKSIGTLAIGAAIGYALNTPAGREKLAQLKSKGQEILGNPEVQAKTADLAEKAREKTSGLPDPVQKVANTTIDAATRASQRQGDQSSSSGSSSSGSSSGGSSSGGSSSDQPSGGSSGSSSSPSGGTHAAGEQTTGTTGASTEGSTDPAAGGVPGTSPAPGAEESGDDSDPYSDRGGSSS